MGRSDKKWNKRNADFIEILSIEQWNQSVSWLEIDIKDKPESVIAFFDDKYGQMVRVINVGSEDSSKRT